MTDEWLTTKQVAALLDVHPATVSDWVSRGFFPGSKKLNPMGKNSHYRVPRQSVESFIKAQTVTPEAKNE